MEPNNKRSKNKIKIKAKEKKKQEVRNIYQYDVENYLNINMSLISLFNGISTFVNYWMLKPT